MRLTVVGSGTAAPEADRACSAYFVQHGPTRLLLDCGPGAVHRMAQLGLPWYGLDHVAISHFHNDHIGDLPMLLFALKWGREQRRSEPLTIWGPSGIRDRLHRLGRALGGHVEDPGFPLTVNELPAGTEVRLSDEITIGVASTPHTEESIAYRLEVEGDGSLGYTGDTGPSDPIARFLRGVDVLIAECSLSDEDAIPTHLSPTSLASLARAAEPGRLVVTHVYPWLDARDVLGLVRGAGWDGGLERARDGLRIDLAPSHDQNGT